MIDQSDEPDMNEFVKITFEHGGDTVSGYLTVDGVLDKDIFSAFIRGRVITNLPKLAVDRVWLPAYRASQSRLEDKLCALSRAEAAALEAAKDVEWELSAQASLVERTARNGMDLVELSETPVTV